MKNSIFYLLIISIFFSCTKPYKPRKTVQISLEKHKIDSSSIRAIEIINDSAVVFAGSKGDVGIISGSKKMMLARKIVTDTIVPHFRALSYTKDNVYALSVANPALLYQINNKNIELVYKEEHDKVFYDSMKFFDELNGIAMGDPTGNCLSVLITRDGGNSWGKIDCEFLPKVEEGEAAFAASNTNLIVKGENAWIVTGGKKARIFHTGDMGLTWKVFNTPITQGKETTGIYTADFYNEKQGIISGGDYLNKFGKSINKAITFDGGETWESIDESIAPYYISCIQYVPGSEGTEVFAVSTSGIFFSNDSGRNWTKVHNEGFYSIRIANKNTAWLSGHEVIAKMNIQ